MNTTPAQAGLATAIITLAGCATQTDTPTPADQPTEPRQSQANQGAGARPIVKPAPRSTPRLDPQMRSEGATALADPSPPANAAIPPSTAEEWQPTWYTGSIVSEADTRVGSAVATHRDLLEARRLAVAAAFDMLDTGAIDQTVTRQLDDGRFRVWVRIAAGS
ncbi:MAG: hypothetical protein AAF937_08280 [Planctomycetota bacterium]